MSLCNLLAQNTLLIELQLFRIKYLLYFISFRKSKSYAKYCILSFHVMCIRERERERERRREISERGKID